MEKWLWDYDSDEVGHLYFRRRITVPEGEHLITSITVDTGTNIWIDGVPIEFSDQARRTLPEEP